jgi:hypothetical protein
LLIFLQILLYYLGLTMTQLKRLPTHLLKPITLVVCCAALVACSDGGNDEILPPTATLADAQGFWSAGAGVSTGADVTANAVILPNGDAWIAYREGSRVTALARATLQLDGNNYKSSGKYYPLPNDQPNFSPENYSFSGSLTPGQGSPLNNSVSIGSGTPSPMTWSYHAAYKIAATQASVQGDWSGEFGSGVTGSGVTGNGGSASVRLDWKIDAAGNLSGSSTTGCGYSGTVRPNANPVAVFDAVISETCNTDVRIFNGIATLNANQNSMTVLYTTDGGNRGGMVGVTK